MAHIPTHMVKTKDLLTELVSHKTFTQKERKLQLLLSIANDFVALKEVRVNGRVGSSAASDLKNLKIVEVVSALTAFIDSNFNKFWKMRFQGSKRSKVLKEQANLKEIFSEESYLWAWFLNGLKQDLKAKKILNSLFDKEYQYLTNLQKVSFRFRRKGPLHLLKILANALGAMSSESETQELQKKVKKAKAHLSNLPQLNILT